MSNKVKLPSITVGITTNYGKEQLLDTVKSLRASKDVEGFRFIIVADSVPVSEYVKSELKKYDVELIENKTPTPAFTKQKQILEMCKDEIIILTQDDVLFDDFAIYNIAKTFVEHPRTTFVCLRNEPLKEKNLLEGAIAVGTKLNNRIGKLWRNGDNYLAVLGRVMAFRTPWLKEKLFVREESVSLDAYLYFENKMKGGEYECLWNDRVYFRCPQNILEHLRKSSRFQHSQLEMQSYRRFHNLDCEYRIPLTVIIRAAVAEFVTNPVNFINYIWVYVYTRLKRIKPENCLYANWEVDLSTKTLK